MGAAADSDNVCTTAGIISAGWPLSRPAEVSYPRALSIIQEPTATDDSMMYCYFTNRDVSPRHRTFPVVTARTGPQSSAPRIRTFRKCGKGEGDPHQRGRAALGVYTACSLPRHRAICSLVPDTIYQPYGVCWGNFADSRVMWRWSQGRFVSDDYLYASLRTVHATHYCNLQKTLPFSSWR